MKHRLIKFLLCLVIFHIGVSYSSSFNVDLSYEIIGEGFHRNLRYNINIKDFNETECAVALHVLLPTAIYVNVDEIEDLKRLKKALACSAGEIDVELFGEKAKSQNVTICDKLRNSESISLSLPIHQRYKFAEENGGYVPVDIPKPKLFLGCKNRIKNHRVADINLCYPCQEMVHKWREIPYEMESVGNKIWLIPVGNLSHLNKVSYVTLSVTSIGALFVLRSLFKLMNKFYPNWVIKED